MSYTDKTITTPFNQGEGHPEGYDFVTAADLLRRITEAALGRAYIDESGNLVYESRNHRSV